MRVMILVTITGTLMAMSINTFSRSYVLGIVTGIGTCVVYVIVAIVVIMIVTIANITHITNMIVNVNRVLTTMPCACTCSVRAGTIDILECGPQSKSACKLRISRHAKAMCRCMRDGPMSELNAFPKCVPHHGPFSRNTCLLTQKHTQHTVTVQAEPRTNQVAQVRAYNRLLPLRSRHWVGLAGLDTLLPRAGGHGMCACVHQASKPARRHGQCGGIEGLVMHSVAMPRLTWIRFLRGAAIG